ncbi:MAG: DEAD/DEAH box helicase, partial [Bacteroidota bacterium]|nr:DEAD/DEAH box helicase [Bacteroidota bacterium]
VMPTSLIHNWLYEVKKWAPELKTLVYTGLNRKEQVRLFNRCDLILTTYGTARNDIELLKKYDFNYVILDESQVIKNPAAKVTRAVKSLKSKYRISLTGTPIENSLSDLWSQFSFLNPGLLGSYKFFIGEFAQPIEKKGDEERRNRLKKIISPFLLRRTKEEVARDLPPLTEKIYFSEMTESQAKIYEEVRGHYRMKVMEAIENDGEKGAQFFILKGLMQLRLIANHPAMYDPEYTGSSGKFDDIINSLTSLLSEGHKVLVYSQFVRHLDLLKKEFEKLEIRHAYLTGSTTNRGKVIDNFKNDPQCQAFLISLKAGGVGLTLTEAEYVFMCDPWWNPATEQQAISRAHRIGQNKSVFAYKFISKDTVEEKIIQLQERKLQLSSGIIQSTRTADHLITKEEVDELFS